MTGRRHVRQYLGGVAVGIGVPVGVGIGVGIGVAVGVAVGVGIGVAVGSAVGVGVGPAWPTADQNVTASATITSDPKTERRIGTFDTVLLLAFEA